MVSLSCHPPNILIHQNNSDSPRIFHLRSRVLQYHREISTIPVPHNIDIFMPRILCRTFYLCSNLSMRTCAQCQFPRLWHFFNHKDGYRLFLWGMAVCSHVFTSQPVIDYIHVHVLGRRYLLPHFYISLVALLYGTSKGNQMIKIAHVYWTIGRWQVLGQPRTLLDILP